MTAAPIDIEDLVEFVVGRLFRGAEEDDWLAKWLATLPPENAAQKRVRAQAKAQEAYAAAKQQARAGKLEELRQILVDLTGDQGIAEFITTPATSSHARKDLAGIMPYVDFARDHQGEMIREIRKLIREKVGAGRVSNALVVEIAAQVLKCSEAEIRTIIRRNYGNKRRRGFGDGDGRCSGDEDPPAVDPDEKS